MQQQQRQQRVLLLLFNVVRHFVIRFVLLLFCLERSDDDNWLFEFYLRISRVISHQL